MGPYTFAELLTLTDAPMLPDYLRVIGEFNAWGKDKGPGDLLKAAKEIQTTFGKLYLQWMREHIKFSAEDFVSEVNKLAEEEQGGGAPQTIDGETSVSPGEGQTPGKGA